MIGVKIGQVRDMALELMEQHGLIQAGWRFGFDQAKRRAGQCRGRDKVITLSVHYAMRNPVDQVKDTVLHEIAHALVGGRHGHDEVWKAKAVEIGAKPERCYDSTQVAMPKGKWKGVCACGFIIERHKRRVGLYHLKCGPTAGRLNYIRASPALVRSLHH